MATGRRDNNWNILRAAISCVTRNGGRTFFADGTLPQQSRCRGPETPLKSPLSMMLLVHSGNATRIWQKFPGKKRRQKLSVSFFVENALTARRLWRALNQEGCYVLAAYHIWRPMVWTHVYLCHFPTPAPFWQCGFEHRHRREKQGYELTFNSGTSRTTGRNGLESLLGFDNLDLELWDRHGCWR